MYALSIHAATSYICTIHEVYMYDGIGMTIPIIGMVGHSAECKKFELWDRGVAQVAKGSFMTLGRLPMFKSFY